MSSEYEVEYLGGEMCGAEILSARFSRPAGFVFKPGQWLILALGDSAERLATTFTICSAPADDYLEITTRLSGSAFKNALLRLQPGDRALVTGPGGRLTLPADATRVAFLVGGVGVTPVRSMLRDAVVRGRVFVDALLLYGNRDASCVPFGTEFEAMADNGVRMVLCYERPPSGWSGASGFITAEMVGRYIAPEEQQRPFVVAGPPVMVEAMERVLDELEVLPGYRIIESFGPKVVPS
jgi:ferredoxin-NADP reductase